MLNDYVCPGRVDVLGEVQSRLAFFQEEDIFALIETCKANDINPYEYLVFALKEATELYETEKEDEIKYLTPAYYKAHLESTGEDL